jgi:hypothetical protein
MTLGTTQILWLSTNREVTAYRVQALPTAFGKFAFRLAKADRGTGPGEHYDVLEGF